MYGQLVEEFDGQRVVDYESEESWEGPGVAYRVREEYDDETSIDERLQSLGNQPGSQQLTALIVGAWGGACEGNDAKEIVSQLAAAAPQLPSLRAIFFGEMTYEECEISWINQTDVSPLLRAFPRLETLRIRGGNGLSFSRVQHAALRELAIETGGLSRSTLRELFLCEFPALEHLELLLGEPNYGFDGGVEDLQPLLSGRLYPQLKYLGLMNSEIANDIAAVVVNSPIVERLETLDLSMGNLDTEGVRSLHALAGQPNLKQLIISHHYASEQDLQALTKAVSCRVVAEDRQEPEDEWRPILHAE
ncbi:MAG: hypothetical protein DWQ34_23435 [Planctomycetota bacterium]|nr:MAG: hypothetical protein DWQ34_23435 [Planctomycetota bacterium]REK24174.1 MAG: hypothetical protein DWQ41_14115 [Planctomycetota bacterium]REK28839.1 MAG: hypothetical protein DWQ45_24400 [Planctomycetota bacterium]